jgi:hypothetical protein
MQLGTRDTNIARLARAQLLAQNANDISNVTINKDEATENIPRRIMIQYITVQPSSQASYIFRIFTRAGRQATPGATNYSMLYEQVITASASIQMYDVSITYVDEDATPNSYKSEDTPNEASGSIWMQIETTVGTNINYDVCVGFKQ